MIEEKHNTDVKAGGQYPLNEVDGHHYSVNW